MNKIIYDLEFCNFLLSSLKGVLYLSIGINIIAWILYGVNHYLKLVMPGKILRWDIILLVVLILTTIILINGFIIINIDFKEWWFNKNYPEY